MYNCCMIVIYTSPGCASCRKAKNYMKEHHLDFIEKNIFNVMLDDKEIRYLLKRSENGTDDIISKRSKIIQENKVDIESMSIDELVRFVVNNPSVLKRPIILDDMSMQVGYDNEEIDMFRRNEVKRLSAVCDRHCPHYSSCGEFREELS